MQFLIDPDVVIGLLLADLISLLDVNPHNEHPGIILESEFFDEADFALRYSNIQRRVVSARIGNVGKYHSNGIPSILSSPIS